MTTLIPRVALLVLGLLTSVSCVARPIQIPPLEELWARADLVCVVRLLSTTHTTDQLTSAGPNYGPRTPEDYQALNSRFQVVCVMKTSPLLSLQPTNELTLLHFRYAENVPEFNGGLFVYFHKDPSQLKIVQTPTDNRQQSQVGIVDPVYLAFLTHRPDGRYQPVTGHYDSEPSFRLLAMPTSGQINYCLDDIARSRDQVEGNE